MRRKAHDELYKSFSMLPLLLVEKITFHPIEWSGVSPLIASLLR
jgi:hypothetical protein